VNNILGLSVSDMEPAPLERGRKVTGGEDYKFTDCTKTGGDAHVGSNDFKTGGDAQACHQLQSSSGSGHSFGGWHNNFQELDNNILEAGCCCPSGDGGCGRDRQNHHGRGRHPYIDKVRT
jgi:hypothetical protein